MIATRFLFVLMFPVTQSLAETVCVGDRQYSQSFGAQEGDVDKIDTFTQTCYNPCVTLYANQVQTPSPQGTQTIQLGFNIDYQDTDDMQAYRLVTEPVSQDDESFENCNGSKCRWGYTEVATVDLVEDLNLEEEVNDEVFIKVSALNGFSSDDKMGDNGGIWYITCYDTLPPSPTISPTNQPTLDPTNKPTNFPSNIPSTNPSNIPSITPSNNPSLSPTTQTPSTLPSIIPTYLPSTEPTLRPTVPEGSPTTIPTMRPSKLPSNIPSLSPSSMPTDPSEAPSKIPSGVPSNIPTAIPSQMPVVEPTDVPFTYEPSKVPSISPSDEPTRFATRNPTFKRTAPPSLSPTLTVPLNVSFEPIPLQANKKDSKAINQLLLVLVIVLCVVVCCFILGAIYFVLFYKKKQKLLIESIADIRYQRMATAQSKTSVLDNSPASDDSNADNYKQPKIRLSLVPGGVAEKAQKHEKFRGSVVNVMARNKELDKLGLGVGDNGGHGNRSGRLSVAPGAADMGPGRLSIMEGGNNGIPAAFSLNFGYNEKNGQVGVMDNNEGNTGNITGQKNMNFKDRVDFYDGFEPYTGDMHLSSVSHSLLPSGGESDTEIDEEARKRERERKQEEFGRMLGDANAAEEMILDDLVEEMGNKNENGDDDNGLAGVVTPRGNDGDGDGDGVTGDGVIEENEDPAENAGYVTGQGPDLDKLEIEEDDDNNGEQNGGENGEDLLQADVVSVGLYKEKNEKQKNIQVADDDEDEENINNLGDDELLTMG